MIVPGIIHICNAWFLDTRISNCILFAIILATANFLLNSYLHCTYLQGRSKRSGWSGFGRITIFQGKNKVPFYKKQVINKSIRVIFELV